MLLLFLLIPAYGCAGSDVDAFIGFVDLFVKDEDDKPEKSESEKWMENQQKKARQEDALRKKRSEEYDQQQRAYMDCRTQALGGGGIEALRKCEDIKPSL